MNQSYIALSGISFIIGFVMSIWPRVCIDRYKKILQQRGKNPNQRITIAMMKELDSKLYRKYLTGLFLWTPFGISFTGFMLAAIFLDK
ncbi:MAG: hypothetical protein K9M54_04960 [Kiritimatiellales bacterium]|nr:hypothetical protein [Kiritimatiellales bacterium]MCF7863363.1 hypothetical protein [Kiritimatiellales bacterium]